MVVVVKGRGEGVGEGGWAVMGCGCINGDGMVGAAMVVVGDCNQDLTLEINKDLTYDEVQWRFSTGRKRFRETKLSDSLHSLTLTHSPSKAEDDGGGTTFPRRTEIPKHNHLHPFTTTNSNLSFIL